MTSTVPVTVLMTVRNGEPYLEAAVRSILGQTFRDFHFLILDNASTDRSREVIRGFQDSRIRLVELERDLGQTAALNRGLALADTPCIARMDADDVCHPVRLERQVHFLREHPEVALLGTWYEVIDPNGCVTDRCRLPVFCDEILRAMLFENQFAHSSVIYRRETALSAGGYDPSFKRAQDYALWWRVGMAHPVANLPEFLVQIRVHPGQVTRASESLLYSETYRIVTRTLDNPDLPGGARSAARQARGYAEIRYATGVAEEGRIPEALARLVRGFLKAPSLFINRAAVNYAAVVLLGKRVYAALRGVRRSLPGGSRP